MNIFIIDDHPWLVRHLCEGHTRDDISVFFLAETFYRKDYKKNTIAEDIDEFFESSIKKPAWREHKKQNNKFSLKDLNQFNQKAIFLINADLKICENTPRQEQNGVELLKHLRLTKELNELQGAHVVLYSFRSLEHLLRHKPGNMILLSPGVSFVSLPDGLDKLRDTTTLIELANERASVDDALIPYVQGDFRLPDAAHQFSNWWGVQQLVNAAITCGYQNLKMPEGVEKEIQKLNNKKALFLFGSKEKNANQNIPIPIPKTISADKHLVMHIDDELEWSYVLENIIKKDSPQTQFKPINKNDIPTSITKGNTTEKKETRKWVKKLLSENAPDLVLVDLRLYGKNEADTPVDKTSGAIVAQLIRDLSPGMPIILMTASNKAWLFEEMMKLGVDAYWMKEGIGDHLPPQGSLNNYIRLKELITTALGEEYQFLRQVVASINDIKKNQIIWWESQSWINVVGSKSHKEVVHPLLNSIVLLVREYLHLFEMKYGYTYKGEEEWKRASLLNAVLMESRKVIETVHQLRGGDFSKQIKKRGDTLGCRLFGDCSWIGLHAKRTNRGGNLTDFHKTRGIVLDLLRWLQNDPR